MEYEENDSVPVRVSRSDDYRTCSVCEGDCEPDPTFSSDEHGARIAFVCPGHGINSVVDLFEHVW